MDRQKAPAPHLARMVTGATDEEIVRALRRFRYDPEFRGAKRVPIRALADLAGVTHMTVYEAMRSNLQARPRKISELHARQVVAGHNSDRGGPGSLPTTEASLDDRGLHSEAPALVGTKSEQSSAK